METFDAPSHYITSLTKFFEILEERHFSTPENPFLWLFRGHGNCEYELLPSIGRIYGKPRFNTLEKLAFFERNALQQFKLATYSELKEDNQFLVLAVAQHHGLKTRLLDWSLSPLVALFFAVENEEMHNVNGAFFAYYNNKPHVDVLTTKKRPYDLDLPEYATLYVPAISPRIKAQSGIFQLFKNPTIPLTNNEGIVEKFFIPAKFKRGLKTQLFTTGISYTNLFPDFDGIAKTINYSVLNDQSV